MLPRIHVQHVGPSGGGGIAVVMTTLVDALREFPELDVEAIASTDTGSKLAKFVTAARAMRRVRRSTACPKRIVHLHAASGVSFWRKACIQRWAHAHGASTILHVHGGGFQEFVEHAPTMASRWIGRTLRSADSVLAVSEAQRSFLSSRFDLRVTLFPNAVPLVATSAPPPPPPLRWLHVGRLGASKGTWDFLDALRKLPSNGLQAWEAVLVGDGAVSEAGRRGQTFGGRVRVVGWQSSQEVDALMRSSHVVVLPSYSEGLPMVLLEAMARARPVISTTVGGIPELVEHAKEGILVRPGDVSALADAMCLLLQNDTLRSELGRRGREKIESGYGIQASARRLRDLYSGLARLPET